MINLQLFTFEKGIATYNGNELKQIKSSQGYIYVSIEGKNRRLHRLIALKYISNPNNLRCVDHIDSDKTNNSIDNLQWITYSNNSSKAYQENPRMSIMHQGSVAIMAKKGLEQLIFPSVRAAARFLNRDSSGVSRVLNGEWSKSAGYELSRVSIMD